MLLEGGLDIHKRKERRREHAPFCNKDVVGPAGGAGVHGLEAQTSPVDLGPECRRWKGECGPGTKQQELASLASPSIKEAKDVSFTARAIGGVPGKDFCRRNQERRSLNNAAHLKCAAGSERKGNSRPEPMEGGAHGDASAA